VRLEVGLDPDAEPGELDERTRQLREELLNLDVQDVARARASRLLREPGPRRPLCWAPLW
jgi:hypothetical protein